MAFDPKKFALLTSAIAASIVVVGATAGGCTVNEVNDADSGTGSSSGEATSSSGGSSSGGSSSGGSSSGGSSSSSGGSSSGSTDAGVDGGSCLGDDGVAPSCENQTGGCLTYEFHQNLCANTGVVFRAAVARAAVDCLRIAPTCEMGGDESNCAAAAIAQACPVDAAVLGTYCDEVAAAAECEEADKPAAVAACKGLAPALNEVGLSGLKNCVADYGGCGESICFDASYANDLLLPLE